MSEAPHVHRGPIAHFFRDWLGFEFVSRIYLYSILIGLVSGLGAVLFTYGLELAKFLPIEKLAGYRLPRPHGEILFDFSFFGVPTYGEHLWLLLLLPAVGGLIGGYLTFRLAPEAQGAGTDAMIDSFHNQRGQIRPVVAPVKALATIITLVQIGAGLGSWVGAKLRLSTGQRRTLLLAGTAGGLGAIFLALALLKILASSCTVSSGGSGGVFGPSLFIGGMLGGAVGLFGQQYFPHIANQPAANIVVGMASFFGAVANTPLAALIIVIEMSGSYHLLPPLMVFSALALIFARNFSIYGNQVQNKFHSPAHMKDLTINVLQNLQVHEIFPLLKTTSEAVITNQLSYFSLSALSKKLGHLHFVVVNIDGALRGMISLEDIDIPEDDILHNLIIIEDMVVDNVSPIDEEDDLHEALQKLLDSGYDKLPVVRTSDEGEDEFLGYLMYLDLMRVYHEEITKLESQE